MRRTSNQDALAVALADRPELWECRGHLFVVADGMGAHAAGELASQIAVDNIPLAYQKNRDLQPCEALVGAMEDANGRIYAKGQHSVDFHGMGTTCSCLALLEAGAVAAHVGDSRVYRLRDQKFEQLTFDHSLVWEMAAAGQATEEAVPAYVPKNVITRSLGPHPSVKVDLEGPLPLQAGDRYLLCSDGLTGPLDPRLIGMIVATLPPDEAAQTLVDLANLLGGPDNITTIVVEIGDPKELGSAKPTPWKSSEASVAEEASSIPAVKINALPFSDIGLPIGELISVALFCYGAATGFWALAAFSGLTALALLGVWLATKAKTPRGNGAVDGFHGKAPYRSYSAAPNAASIGMLGEIVRQLEDLEGQRDWPIDWPSVRALRDQAHQAIARGDFSAAVVAYAGAVRTLMHAVRASRSSPPDSGIRLGVD
jgi:protein phosphatase